MSFYDVVLDLHPNMKPYHIALMLEIRPSQLYNWRTQKPGLKTLLNLADRMGLDPLVLVDKAIADLRKGV